jgi:protein involved in polysaccharide export with SLBB domain
MNTRILFAKLVSQGTALLCMTLAVSSLSLAQNRDYPSRSRALSEADSRAEQEAERMVSLPAERIITLLEKEPGLFLQVKKLLVRTAYQQGRVLDPKDLTDETLFRLIRRDENIRILITNEIEDRNYIRAKPTRAEIARDWQRQQEMAAGVNGTQSETTDTTKDQISNQEDAYWSRQQQQLLRNLQKNPNSPSVQPLPENTQPSSPQNIPANDPRRTLLQAQLQGQNGDYDGLPLDVLGGGSQISPDQLSQLLSARRNDQSSIIPAVSPVQGLDTNQVGTGTSNALGNATGSPTDNGIGLYGAPLSGSSFPAQDFPTGEDSSRWQQAKLEEQNWPSSRRRASPILDQPALQHRVNPYADIPSLYDLYSQYARRSPVLTRFGTDIFENGTGNMARLPMDLPAGPDYVLGPGDGLNIDLWGGVSQRLRRVVDREGRVTLPEIGGVQVSGRTLGDVQHMVQIALRTELRNVRADISLARLRTVRVYVVGDVRRPGAYDVSSLSTPLNALYEAGGPTSRGSLRILKHFRGKQLVEDVDLYDLLLHGVHSGMQRIESGDTILVPPINAEVTIEGMVRRPAVYELYGEKSLAEVLQLAGGVLTSGTLRHVDVERVQAHESRTMLRLDVPETNNQASVTQALEDFKIQDGDKIKISPILPFSDKSIYLDGHVFRPGKYAYQDGMKVTDLIKSYNDLLPEPYVRHAEIIRLSGPDHTPEILAFNLQDALAGKEQDVALKPFDTVRVFGRFDFEDPPVVTVSGEVRDPGDHITNGVTYLRDAVYLAGNTTPDAQLDDVQIFRKIEDGKLKVLSVNLSKALAGDATQNILLLPKDRVFIHKSQSKADPPTVEIQGEVGKPGKYPLGSDMTAADLVRLAGGLKRSAYTQEADLTRYLVEQGSHVAGEHVNVPLAQALAGEPDADVRLHDGDVLTIRQLSGWNDIGATIEVKGEVVHPGTYGIREGERLSDVLARAGGLRPGAYPYGAILERAQIRDLEEKNRAELIRTVQEEGTTLKTASDDPVAQQASMLQWKDTLQKLQSTPPVGRLVIHISSNPKRWANSPSDIQLRAGDTLFIPKRPNFVMVDGAVYNQTAITFKPGKSASWYLQQAGGPTTMADKRGTFVIRADGSVMGGKGGLFTGGALDAALQPGDMVVVPDKAFGAGFKWKQTLQVAQLVSAVGIAIQVARTF